VYIGYPVGGVGVLQRVIHPFWGSQVVLVLAVAACQQNMCLPSASVLDAATPGRPLSDDIIIITLPFAYQVIIR
jgi:hypothetical protein